MGCCVSSATDHQKDELFTGKNTTPPPSVFVEEKTVVKEVLSESTFLAHDDNSTVETATTTTTTTISDDDEKNPGTGTADVAPDPVLSEPGSGKGSEICSLSASLLSIVKGYDEEEVKQRIPQVVRQRSPAKSRSRVMVNYPARINDMSPCKRNTEGGGGAGSARLVSSGKRDPTERSERRSRSPATNRSAVVGPTRSQYGTDNGRRVVQSPGRIRPDPNKNGSDQDYHLHLPSYSGRYYGSTLNDTFENPLVSLECFIFL